MKSLYEQLGGSYHQEGDYLIPDLVPPPSPSSHIGIWGHRRRQYLLKHRETLYTVFLLSGKLTEHLVEVDQQAQEMVFHLVDQMARAEGITEQLKASDQMAWVGAMNNTKARAEEVVYEERIYS